MTIEMFAKLVADERERQEQKFPGHTCSSDSMTDPERATVLFEEVGEVARAVLDGHGGELYVELVQVAAVCAAWIEAIEVALARDAEAAAAEGEPAAPVAETASPLDADGRPGLRVVGRQERRPGGDHGRAC